MAKVNIVGLLMAHKKIKFMKEIFRMINYKDLERRLMMVEKFIKANGKIGRDGAKDNVGMNQVAITMAIGFKE